MDETCCCIISGKMNKPKCKVRLVFLPLTGHRPSVLEQIIYCVIDSSILWIILLFWELHSKLTLGERRRKHWTESTPGWQSMFTSRWRYQLTHISPEKQKEKTKGAGHETGLPHSFCSLDWYEMQLSSPELAWNGPNKEASVQMLILFLTVYTSK